MGSPVNRGYTLSIAEVTDDKHQELEDEEELMAL